jgi:dTDP-glucose 4,6-dehydratase
MKNILVTGGAGFIGSHFIKYLLNKYMDYNVINLDCLTYAGNLLNLKEVEDNPRYFFIKGDIRNKATIVSIFKEFKIQIIVNFAAESHVDRSIVSSDDFVSTNILGTHILLNVAKEYWSENQTVNNFDKDVKFVQISTDEVYGSLADDGYFTEDTPLSPNSPYSASKASADLLVQSYFRTYGMPVNITRCSNNYGPNQYPEKLIPLVIKLAYQNQFVPVYGEGHQVREWIHVLDHCSAIDEVIHSGKVGEIYNIGSEFEMKNIDIVKLILNKMNKPISLIKHVDDRLGHDYRYAINNSKIKRDLGWKPSVSFDIGIDSTIAKELEKYS